MLRQQYLWNLLECKIYSIYPFIKMKTTILLITLIIGELTGLLFIYLGIKWSAKSDVKFRWKHLSQDNPISKSSGTQLIIEGVFIIIAGIAFYYVWFIW